MRRKPLQQTRDYAHFDKKMLALTVSKADQGKQRAISIDGKGP
jgi:hypothetical protein